MFRRILLCSVAAPSRTLVVYIDALLFHAFILLFHNRNPKTSASPTSHRTHTIREHPIIIIIILNSSQLSQTSISLVQQAIPTTRPTKTHHLQTLATTHTLQHSLKTRSTEFHQNNPHLSHTLQAKPNKTTTRTQCLQWTSRSTSSVSTPARFPSSIPPVSAS